MAERDYSLEGNLENERLDRHEQNYTSEDLRRWEKKWKKFHRSLPDKIIFGDCFIFYRQSYNNALYTTTPPSEPLKKRRWYWPFWPI